MLVPIKVKIYLKPNGRHLFPSFNDLPSALRGETDWSYFFDSHGIGWHYDKLSGHGEKDQTEVTGDIHLNDDLTCWYGATCVPAAFADAAASAFPDTVEIISEASFERFYNDRAHIREEEEIRDLESLQKLEVELSLESRANPPKIPTAATNARRAEMLDPNHPRRGVRKNHRRFWADFKVRRGVVIRDAEALPE